MQEISPQRLYRPNINSCWVLALGIISAKKAADRRFRMITRNDLIIKQIIPFPFYNLN